jgi:hypothetical protein
MERNTTFDLHRDGMARYEIPIRPITTSDVSQFKGNVHHHFIDMARFYTNHDRLRIGVVQVEKCELPKDFSDSPIENTRNRDLVRQFIEEGCASCCGLLNFVVKCVNLLCKW